MTALGAIFLPHIPPERLLDVAREADAAGLEELWLWEDSFLNAGVSAGAAALAATTNLRVGIGLLPVPFRNVALAAMEIATLHRMFGDRAMVGVGHGVLEWMQQVGSHPASPMALLREHVTALQSLLAGAEVTVDGEYVHLDRVKLAWPPDPRAALYLGGRGPRTLALSGELANGTILMSGTTPDDLRRSREEIGAKGEHRVVVFVATAFGADADERLASEDRVHGESGLGGDSERILEGARAWAEAGADAVILEPLPSEPDPIGFVRIAAETVSPLARAALGDAR